MNSLADTVLSSLDAHRVQSIAQQLGLGPQEAGSAIQSALPLLLGQMARNAAQPDAANALLDAARRDHAKTHADDVLGSLLGSLAGGGSGNDNPLSGGLAILGHVFGGKAQTPQVNGLDSGQSTQLLALLAPLVMAALGRLSQGSAIDASSLSRLLGHEGQRIAQAPPSALGGLVGLLDRDGDGQVGVNEMLQGAQALGTLFGKQ